jgi:TonB family protein
MRRYEILYALISTVLFAQDFDGLRQAVTLHPNDVKPHLDLGTAYMRIAPEQAEMEFRRVLELDPNNPAALANLGALSSQATSLMEGDEKIRKLNEALEWYARLAAVDPTNKEVFRQIGVLMFGKWNTALADVRAKLNRGPHDSSPLPDLVRKEFKAKYSSVIDASIANLEHALQIDPGYEDALVRLSMEIEDRAKFSDSTEDRARDEAAKKRWLPKVMEIAQQEAPIAAPPAVASPAPVRVGGAIQEPVLIRKVTPLYPQFARASRITGTVRFTVVIGKDGGINSMQIVSGHPELAFAAQAALQQYVYKPTIVDGNPVEVVTQVSITFPPAN